MTETAKSSNGPLWQIEQQIKSCEGRARAWRNDADRYMRLAEEADTEKEQYEKARDVLIEAGFT